jgi:hypothetical protein
MVHRTDGEDGVDQGRVLGADTRLAAEADVAGGGGVDP